MRAVVPALVTLLEHRAFLVDTHRIQDGPVDISPYRGLIIGSPSFGLGIRGAAPTEALDAYVRDELPDLDDLGVALFVVYQVRPGTSLDRMRGMIFDKGAELVVAHAYSRFRLDPSDHTIAAECMVRIR